MKPKNRATICPKHVELFETANRTETVASSLLSILFISRMHGQASMKFTLPLLDIMNIIL